jgi:hypothetical protein
MCRYALFFALICKTPLLYADLLPERSERVVDYEIRVRLDPELKQLHGSERLTWRNPSSDSVPDLWFHLYLNAFRNSQSTFIRESGGQLRGIRMKEDRWGWIEVRSMRIAGGPDITDLLCFEHPDDDNAEDRTVARLPLPKPVPPRGSITLEIEFLAQLPEVYARTGYKRDFIFAGQWFPKLGVYEPSGMRGRTAGGWNCHQFHSMTEFYADFGRYHVEVTLPDRFVLGATGRRLARRNNGDGTTTHVYEQEDVHDFAWTADPRYIEIKRTFSAAKDVSIGEYRETAALLDRPLEQVRLSDVEITLLLSPGHEPQADRYFDAAKLGIKWFGLRYGRYPYATLTVVDPAPGALGAGGMEYPTLITGGTSFVLNRWPFDRIRMPEMVTVHEFGHQFWYGLVANNEFEEAWLDEGITSYSTGRVMEAGYGSETALLDFFGLRMNEIDSIRMQNNPNQRFNAIVNAAWKYAPQGAYGFYSYRKPEIVLRTLENYLGEQKMARVMRTFHERWRFRHPSSDDFFAVANEAAGEDLGWFFREAFLGTGVLDYQVRSISTRRIGPPFGVFEKDGKRVTITREDADRQEKSAKGRPERYESVAIIGRVGELSFPVDVELKFEGAAPERVRWDGRERTLTYRVVRPARLEWVNVDPERKIVLDVDWLNNWRRLNPDGRAAAAWGFRYLFWLQNLLAFIGI